jgi:hypothetical protein
MKQVKHRGKKYKSSFIKIYARCVCGCCDAQMAFTSVDSAARAFEAAGLTSNAVIVDDKGNAHEGIDTFYGFSTSDQVMAMRGLGYLFNQI